MGGGSRRVIGWSLTPRALGARRARAGVRRLPARDGRALAALLLLGAALAAALALTLSHAAPRRSGTNGVGSETVLASLQPGVRVCQSGELLPAGTAAVRLSVPTEKLAGASAAGRAAAGPTRA